MTTPVWADTHDQDLMREVADFFVAEIKGDASYISHGEIQVGLSEDGRTWHPDLQSLMRDDLSDLGPDRSVLYIRDGDALTAAAIILWVNHGRTRFAVIEDMAVQSAKRSGGLGQALMDAIEAKAQSQDMGWLFLESGLENERAHAFFERSGFNTVSKVFAKPI